MRGDRLMSGTSSRTAWSEGEDSFRAFQLQRKDTQRFGCSKGFQNAQQLVSWGLGRADFSMPRKIANNRHVAR